MADFTSSKLVKLREYVFIVAFINRMFTGHSNLNIESDSGLIVHDWFSGRKQTLLSDFVIGTVDQLLITVQPRFAHGATRITTTPRRAII